MVLTSEIIERRLCVVDQTTESIQTTSMWIMHHKDCIVDIVKTWLELIKSGKEPFQVALFYVANDVCQKAKKRGDGDLLLNAFAPHWTHAISHVKSLAATRDNGSVLKAVERILDIFDDRLVYSKSQLEDMRSALNGLNDTDDGAFEFDTDSLAKDIEAYQKGEMVMERARGILARSDFNFKDKIKSRMKDRQEGEKFLEEIDTAQKKLDNFLSTLTKHKKRATHLVEILEAGKRFFNLQLRDVTVVEDAYQKFSVGIDSVRIELDDMLKTSAFPGASPPRDAPSPTPNEDPFQGGMEAAFQQLKRPKENINTEVTDMDVDNDEEHLTEDVHQPKPGQSIGGHGQNISIAGLEVLRQAVPHAHTFPAADPRIASQSHLTSGVGTSAPLATSSRTYPITTIVQTTTAPVPQITTVPNVQKTFAGTLPIVSIPRISNPMAPSTSGPAPAAASSYTNTLAVHTEPSPSVSAASSSSKPFPPQIPAQFSPMAMPPNWMLVPPPNFAMPPHYPIPPFPPPTASSLTPPLPPVPAVPPPEQGSMQSATAAAENFLNPGRFPVPAPGIPPIPALPSPSNGSARPHLPAPAYLSMPPPPFAPPAAVQPLPSPSGTSSILTSPATIPGDASRKGPLLPTSSGMDIRKTSGPPPKGYASQNPDEGRRLKSENFRNYDNSRRDRPYDRPMERRYSHGDQGRYERNDMGRYGRHDSGGRANGNRGRR